MILSAISVYPIKSLKGIALSEANVERRGLLYDRRWMLVDEKNKFLTQREFPKMAIIQIAIGEGCLIATVDDLRIVIPLIPYSEDKTNVKIWTSSVKAKIYPVKINEWFSQVIGTKCRLVLMPEETKRMVNPFYAVSKFHDTVSFADGYPFMLIGESSLADLNSRLQTPLPMNRFRPNFVISGTEPFAEDSWKKIRIGETVFHVVKPCARCVITTIDQSTGESGGKEPLKTLSSYRNKGGKVLFGQNLIADQPSGTVRLGDKIEII
ncbi:MAG: MOSC N-terminal beta barrel domain-containing protein [Pyrinomonadaceae bacterium]